MPQFPLPGAGQVITYQLAGVKPYGMRYKITPETTEKEVNARKCFQLPGSKEDVVKAQSVFPSLDGFKVRGGTCSSLEPTAARRTHRMGAVQCTDACRALGGLRHIPHPRAQGGSFPHPHRGRTPHSFPNPEKCWDVPQPTQMPASRDGSGKSLHGGSAPDVRRLWGSTNSIPCGERDRHGCWICPRSLAWAGCPKQWWVPKVVMDAQSSVGCPK